jgi:CheY-like chemotaxis protein
MTSSDLSDRPIRRRSKILIVDDSPVCCEVASLILRKAGHTVVSVYSPIGFVNLLRREQPELVLVDVAMPAMSGPKLVELALKKKSANCAIVLYSDRPQHELAQLVLECGADGYIPKSADGPALTAAAAKFIARKMKTGPVAP